MTHKVAYRVAGLVPAEFKSECIAVGIYQKKNLSPAAKQLDKASGGYLTRLLEAGDFAAKTGQSLLLYDVPNVNARRVLLLGCGEAGTVSLRDYQVIHQAFIQQITTLGVAEAASFLTQINVSDAPAPKKDAGWAIRHAVVCCEYALYRFDSCRGRHYKADKLRLRTLHIAQNDDGAAPAQKAAATQGQAIGEGINLARTLGNLPANVCTPEYLAKQARSLSKQFESIKTSVLNDTAMEKLGMHSLLSVARGSVNPARLVVLEYNQGKAGAKPVVLVGKGITFDTGGISLKPGLKMDEMKFDMCGAASVLGTLHACARMQLKANIVGIMACAENMPGGKATKPGDIVTSMSGQTIEILNTDAEGRLVLCDALTYAERFKPAAVIDIATLTGACIVALGRVPSGLLGNDNSLVNAIKTAAEVCGDRVWQLPLWREYRDLLKSNFADLANIGGPDGGTITAATFLSYFTEKYPWAHLDIAGTAWLTGEQKGATGRPVALLTQYVMDNHS